MYSGVKNVEYVYVSLFPCPSSSPVGSKASLGSHLSFQAAERFSTEAFPGLQHLVVRYNGQVLSIPAIVPVGRLAIEHDDVSKILYIYTYVCNIHTYALYMYTHNVDIRMQIYIYMWIYVYVSVYIRPPPATHNFPKKWWPNAFSCTGIPWRKIRSASPGNSFFQ